MALIKCRECGKEISDKASTCPHCGIEIKKDKIKKDKIKKDKNNKVKKSKKKLILIILSVIFIIGIIITLFFLFRENEVQTNLRDDTKQQVEIITEYINIRESQDVSSDILGKVHKGEIYDVLSENTDSKYNWIEIETSNGIRGYISGIEDYVKKLDTTTNIEKEQETITGIYEAGDFKIMLLDNSECNFILGYIEGYDDISVSTNNCKWYSIDTDNTTKVYINYIITTTTMYGQTYNKQESGEWTYSNGALSNEYGGYYVKIQ